MRMLTYDGETPRLILPRRPPVTGEQAVPAPQPPPPQPPLSSAPSTSSAPSSSSAPAASTTSTAPSFGPGVLLTDPTVAFAVLSELQSLRQGISALLAASRLPPLPPPAFTLSMPHPPPTSTAGPAPVPSSTTATPQQVATPGVQSSEDTEDLFAAIDTYQSEDVATIPSSAAAQTSTVHYTRRARSSSSAQPSPSIP